MENFAERLQIVSVQFVPFMMAVVFHEFAHGWMAKRFGDITAQRAGRLTLNPLPHIDPIGTVLFPLINMLSGINLLIGWAKPVPIDPRQFSKLRPGLFFVSLAGPLMNFSLAVLSALVFCAVKKWLPDDTGLKDGLLAMTYVSISLNFALGFFNLIPIPPLDGGKVLQSVLPPRLAVKLEKIAPYTFFILMALLLTGSMSILARPISFLSDLTLVLSAMIFGL